MAHADSSISTHHHVTEHKESHHSESTSINTSTTNDSTSPAAAAVQGLRHVQAPENKPQPAQPAQPHLPPGQNICADCERLIV